MIFKKNKTKVEWEINFLHPIWRVFPNHQNCIITEVRNVTDKVVSYHCVNAVTGLSKWDNIQLSQTWWIGIEGIFGDVVILHEYERPDLPAHKKIIAVDINTGKTLWSNDELIFISSGNNYLIASRNSFAATQKLKLNLLTGDTLCELNEDEFISTSKELKNNERLYYQTPFEFSINELQNKTVHRFIKKQNKKDDIADPVEVFTDVENDVNVIGYSRKVLTEASTPMYDEFIYVLSNKHTILYKDKIVSSVNMPVIPKYFVKINFLYHIKDKTILKVVKLYESNI
ncbi:MAG: DUF4905 domain-containing protein [Bacteroidota bacterium]|nr:DUF4905 domain-containing protein [Bacteroidota bacterium]